MAIRAATDMHLASKKQHLMPIVLHYMTVKYLSLAVREQQACSACVFPKPSTDGQKGHERWVNHLFILFSEWGRKADDDCASGVHDG